MTMRQMSILQNLALNNRIFEKFIFEIYSFLLLTKILLNIKNGNDLVGGHIDLYRSSEKNNVLSFCLLTVYHIMLI